MIVRVLPSSAAESDAMLRVGDVVVYVDGRKLGRKILKQARVGLGVG